MNSLCSCSKSHHYVGLDSILFNLSKVLDLFLAVPFFHFMLNLLCSLAVILIANFEMNRKIKSAIKTFQMPTFN